MEYRAGFPGWKIAAKLGVPISFRSTVYYDLDARSYWATSRDLDGLVVSGDTLDELKNELLDAATALMELKIGRRMTTIVVADLRLSAPMPAAP